MTIACFDGLVGPTHNYSGLSFGNKASVRSRGKVSHPRAAALQGLEKMKFVRDLGVPQGFFPPHPRPHLETLRRLGFSGDNQMVMREAAAKNPRLVSLVNASSFMWAANAATVAPSTDCVTGKVGFVPANLRSTFHRSLEAKGTSAMLRHVFNSDAHFFHRDPLPPLPGLGDEGAANHTLFTRPDGRGVHLFVFGRGATDGGATKFPARQDEQASRAVARLLGLPEAQCVFAEQNPVSIDAGVFHNDVISVGHEHLFLCHELAFKDPAEVRHALSDAMQGTLRWIGVTEAELPLADAVSCYLFNSQIVTESTGDAVLICPTEVQDNPRSRKVVDRIVVEENPIRRAHFLDVRESMANGGGPACLRLRVPLTEDELSAVSPEFWLSDENHEWLVSWITNYYRADLVEADLASPQLMDESSAAMAVLAEKFQLDYQSPMK